MNWVPGINQDIQRQGDSVHILGVIPARGGSKGVKDKNILDLNGKPLIGYTIEAALISKFLDRIIVSTDSDKIANVVKDMYKDKIEVIKRPAELAKDDSPIEEALLHTVEYLEQKEKYITDITVWMQANVPIRRKGIIDEAIEKLINSDADSCVTCYEADQIPEAMKIINEKGRLISVVKDINGIRRQEFPKRYLLDGSVVVLKTENLFKTRGIRKGHIYLGKEIIPIIQEKKMYLIEIDIPNDILLVKYYMEQINAEEQ